MSTLSACRINSMTRSMITVTIAITSITIATISITIRTITWFLVIITFWCIICRFICSFGWFTWSGWTTAGTKNSFLKFLFWHFRDSLKPFFSVVMICSSTSPTSTTITTPWSCFTCIAISAFTIVTTENIYFVTNIHNRTMTIIRTYKKCYFNIREKKGTLNSYVEVRIKELGVHKETLSDIVSKV